MNNDLYPTVQRGDCRLQKLEMLVTEAEKRVIDLTAIVLTGSSGNANISPAQLRVSSYSHCHIKLRVIVFILLLYFALEKK